MLINQKNLRKYKVNIIIGVALLLITLVNIRQCSDNSNTKKELGRLQESWKQAEKVIDDQIRVNDSLYSENKKSIAEQLRQYDSLKTINQIKFQKELTDLKKKYDKEYTDVTGTSIDSTLIISRQQLSQDIDYSKFTGKH
jgi:hypothetical protein